MSIWNDTFLSLNLHLFSTGNCRHFQKTVPLPKHCTDFIIISAKFHNKVFLLLDNPVSILK